MKIFFLTVMFATFASTIWADANRELFIQKYQATFGITPTNEVWNLAKANCKQEICRRQR